MLVAGVRVCNAAAVVSVDLVVAYRRHVDVTAIGVAVQSPLTVVVVVVVVDVHAGDAVVLGRHVVVVALDW